MFEVFWSPLPDFVADTHPVWLFLFQGGIAWHRTTNQSKHPKRIQQARSAWEWAAPPISSAFISAQRARTPWRTRWSGWCVMMWKQIISKAKIVCNTSVFYLDRNDPKGTVLTEYYRDGKLQPPQKIFNWREQVDWSKEIVEWTPRVAPWPAAPKRNAVGPKYGASRST